MKVGIIIHSLTGHTLSVGEKLQDELKSKGHQVELKRFEAVNEKESKISNIKLKNIPSIDEYDYLVFGGPVHGFSISLPMKSYLNQLPDLNNKKVACFVTQFFPFAWMGGNHSISQMIKICEAKKANLFGTNIINWSRRKRNIQIQNLIDDFSKTNEIV